MDATTFRTSASEYAEAPEAVMKLSLAHAVESAALRAYARSDLFEKRRALLDDWGAFATG